jgi:hypothetical protein
MRTKDLRMLALVPLLLAGLGLACSTQRGTNDVSYKDNVQKALEQADLKDVTVSEDRDKNTITLAGSVHSADAKRNAGDVAQAAAGNRIIANEVSVQPVGAESEAKDMASNLDDAIEKNYKAMLIAKGLDKEPYSLRRQERSSHSKRYCQIRSGASGSSTTGAGSP